MNIALRQLIFTSSFLLFCFTCTTIEVPCSCVSRWTGGDEWGANATLISQKITQKLS
jgi:hypothetical protein